jgi:PTH1 family peptidyl-tRNA hydrolase
VNIPWPAVPLKKGKESVPPPLPPPAEQPVTFAKQAGPATLAQRVKRVISLFDGKEQDSKVIAAKRGIDGGSPETGKMATCWLLKPTIFMNRSGQAVAALANYYKIPAEQILVVHDDLDFLPGTVRLKPGGGDGRHNGLKDIIAQLGSSQFLRLRLGIGHPGKGGDVTAYVLNAPMLEEKIAIDAATMAALEVIPLIVAGEVEKATQQLHSQT